MFERAFRQGSIARTRRPSWALMLSAPPTKAKLRACCAWTAKSCHGPAEDTVEVRTTYRCAIVRPENWARRVGLGSLKGAAGTGPNERPPAPLDAGGL